MFTPCPICGLRELGPKGEISVSVQDPAGRYGEQLLRARSEAL